MLSIPNVSASAFDDPGRNIQMKIEIYFDGDDNPPYIVYGEDELVDASILIETQADDASPFGNVSANELSISLVNRNNKFSPKNVNGPFYGKMNINTLVKPYCIPLHALPTGNTPEEITIRENAWVPMGVYWVNDWIAKNGSLEASVECYDILNKINQLDTPNLPVEHYGSIYSAYWRLLSYWRDLVPALDFDIDGSLASLNIKYHWVESLAPLALLEQLTIPGYCVVYADALGKVHVKSNLKYSEPLFNWNDFVQLQDAFIPNSLIKTYSSVVVDYNSPTVATNVMLGSQEGLVAPIGASSTAYIKASNPPIKEVDYVKTSPTDTTVELGPVKVDSYTWDSFGFKASLNNINNDRAIKVEAFGTNIQSTYASVKAEDPAAILLYGTKPLPVSSPFIQDDDEALIVANHILDYVKRNDSYIETSIQGNPMMEISDSVTIQSDKFGINATTYVPIRMKYFFDGGLRGEFSGVLVDTSEVLNV